MSSYLSAWKVLCGEDSLHLSGRVVAMDLAMRIVKKKFKEACDKLSCMNEDKYEN